MMGNVLIIDDSPIERKIICQVLEKRLPRINLFEAENGLDITGKVSAHNIHVCILDIMMPIKDGFQVLKEIRQDAALMDIPVIVCTGINDRGAIEKALTLGCYDYFSKPLSEEAMKISLPLKVKNAIENMKRKDEIIYLSYHDKLTGLYNERFCKEELERLDTEENLPITLIVGDVNGLKLTNDAFGHEAGDRLLIKIGNIIKGECTKDDIIARIGGDEFVIILPKKNAADAEKIIDRIKEKCDLEKEDPIKPSISMGFAEKEYKDQDSRAVYKLAEERMYNVKLMESKNIKDAIVLSLRKTLNTRFPESEMHSNRLMELSHKFGRALGMSLDQINNLKLLASLHDIGLTAIAEDTFNEIGNDMSDIETRLNGHCEVGYRIAGSFPHFAHISNDILSHHEQWDGNGYPQGLVREHIPLNARIISILDTYDTMVHGRVRRKAVSQHEALRFIRNEAGKRFDPKIAETFVKMISLAVPEETQQILN